MFKDVALANFVIGHDPGKSGFAGRGKLSTSIDTTANLPIWFWRNALLWGPRKLEPGPKHGQDEQYRSQTFLGSGFPGS
jgi:hypothetical protein